MTAISYVIQKDAFSIKFDKCSRQPLSWKEELSAAALAVAFNAKKPVWLCFSGGTESEIMCNTFHTQGIHFSVLTLRYADGSNEHEVEYSQNWCRTRGVQQKILTVEILNIVEENIPAHVEKGGIAPSIRHYIQIKLMQEVSDMNGFAVIASGKPYFKIDTTKIHPSTADIFISFSPNLLAPLEWMRERKSMHEPFFMYSTPEVILAYLRVPIIDFAINHPEMLMHPSNMYLLRRLALQSIWPELRIRAERHYFESSKEKSALEERLFAQNSLHKPYRMSINEFLDQLTPSHI